MKRRTDPGQLALFSEPRCKRCGESCCTPVCWVCLPTLQSMSAFGEEWWIDVPNHEGAYDVSTLGRVRSLDRVVVRRGQPPQRRKGQALKAAAENDGRLHVNLAGRPVRVHRLMLMSFVGPPPPALPEGAHRNDIPDDNRLANLRWTSRSGNQLDMVRNGNHANARKTHCKRGHPFTADNTIRRRRPNGGRKCRQCQRDYEREWRNRTTGTGPVGKENTP